MISTGLRREQLNARFLKRTLMNHLFWRLKYPIIIDEHQFMDVFAIRRNGYMVEFEIKVTRADLMREIKLSKCAQPIKYSKNWVKWEKHARYLKRQIEHTPSIYDSIPGYNNIQPTYFIPNEFYFYVPDFLVDIAIKETAHTPYGVVKIGNHILPASGNTIFSNFEVVNRAVKIHNEKATEYIYRQVAHGLTIRNKLLQG